MFKNSIKIFGSNLDKVWKKFVYQLFCIAVTVGLACVFFAPITDALAQAWTNNNIGQYFVSGTFYGLNISEVLSSLIAALLDFVSILFSTNAFACIYLFVLLFILYPFLSSIGKFAYTEMMYAFMSSGSKTSFTATLLGTLNRSTLYALAKTIFSLPATAIILSSTCALMSINNEVYSYFLPLIIVIVPSLLIALWELLTAGWALAMVVFGDNVFVSYGKGLRASFRCGGVIYGNLLMFVVLTFVLTMICGLYSLIVILPLASPMLTTLDAVGFFSSQGMRYYVDAETIVSPKRLEEEDRIEKAKYLL